MAGRSCSETRESAVAQAERRLTYSWDEVFSGRVGSRFGSWGGGQDRVALEQGLQPELEPA